MISKVYVEITNICNLDCSFCHKTKRDKALMSSEQFEYIAKQMRQYAKYLFFHLMGEPTNHPQLPEFIKTANSLGYKTVLTTNGTLLGKRGDEILKNPPHRINISLHSYEANSKNPHPDMESYISSCLDFAQKCSEQKIFCVLRLWNLGGLENENGKILNDIKNKFANEWLETDKGYRIADRVFLEWDKYFEWPDVNNKICNQSCYCLGAKDQVGILADGTVVPCCLDSEGVVNLGNIFKQPFIDIYNSQRYKTIIKEFEKRKAAENLCRHCGYAQRF